MSSDNSPPLAPPQRRSSCMTSALALVALAGLASMLLVIPTGFIGPSIVLGGIAFVGLLSFHYFVWGRWLSQELQAQELPDAEQSKEDSTK